MARRRGWQVAGGAGAQLKLQAAAQDMRLCDCAAALCRVTQLKEYGMLVVCGTTTPCNGPQCATNLAQSHTHTRHHTHTHTHTSRRPVPSGRLRKRTPSSFFEIFITGPVVFGLYRYVKGPQPRGYGIPHTGHNNRLPWRLTY